MDTPTKALLRQPPVRSALALLIGIVVSFVLPGSKLAQGHGADVAAAVIFSVSLLVFARQTANRRRDLLSAVYLELNKLRRLYHISKNLTAAATGRFRSWFMEVHGNLHMYLAAFEGASLHDYSGNNPGFRRLSYHIYTAPDMETEKERVLYADLLKTTGVIAETRQKIKELIVARMSRADWAWLFGSALAAALACVAVSDGSGSSRLACGLVIGTILAGLDYVWRMDLMERETRELAERYVRNISKLEYRRRQ